MKKAKAKTGESGQRLTELVIFRASPVEAATIDRLVRKTGRNRSEILRGLLRKIRA